METKTLTLSAWDDLVFEKRNKEYGAYALRQMYVRRLVLGLGVSTAMMTILLFLPQLFPGAPDVIPSPVKQTIFKLSQPPSIPKRDLPPPRPTTPRQTVQRQNTTIRVVTEPVADVPVVDVQPAPVPDNAVFGTDEVVADVEPAAVTVPTGPVDRAEIMPEYEGGMQAMMKYLGRKLRYPPSAERLKIEGTVFVSFVVNGDGKVSDVNVIRGIHPDCDKEAVRVISSMPGWKGGRQNGFPVGVKMVLPIKFQIRH